MIAGFYYDPKITAHEKVPGFFLPSKINFQTSIGYNFESILTKNKCPKEDVIIFGNFCEIVGPMPVLVHPNNNQMTSENLDMIVLKAMSVDYQSCEHGDFVLDTTTQALMLDCPIPFFVHYFTLWDIYARGYVRPCCIIVCCRDKTRTRELFNSTHVYISDLLKPILADNVDHFFQELRMSKEEIDKKLSLHRDNPLMNSDEFDIDHLVHLQNEYSHLLTNVLKQIDIKTHPWRSSDMLLDMGLATVSIKRELRSIYSIMGIDKCKLQDMLASIGEMFSHSKVSESFSLSQLDSLKDVNITLFNPAILDHDSKFNINYYGTALTFDKTFTSVNKASSVCQCRTLFDNLTVTDETPLMEDFCSDVLFPNLHDIKPSQSNNISNHCKQLGIAIVLKLLTAIFNQCNLIIIVNTYQSYMHLMNFLMLFLPKAHNSNFFICKTDWPVLEQLMESPVFMINKDTKSPEMPNYLQGFVAVYDYTINQFICGPKYIKGHLSNFLDSFKYLEYNPLHLDTILNIMLLNYVDMVYQWCSLLAKRDRRWIIEEHLKKLGYTPEDIMISENLANFVLQTLSKAKQTPEEANLFLISKSLCQFPIARK